MARPSPVPPYLRVVEPSACSNGSKIARRFSAGMPIPVSATEKRSEGDALRREGLDVDRDGDLAMMSELDRVADEVDHDLAESARVADHAVGNVGRDPAG